MTTQTDSQFMILFFAVVLMLGGVLGAVIANGARATPPFRTRKRKLPGPDRNADDEALFHFDLDELLDMREDIEIAFEKGGLKGRETVAEACRRWRQYACRQKSLSALALATALCRLCPEDMPASEVRARHEELLQLTGEGEGNFLLGLSHIRLYAHFHPKDERMARDAWRRAVEHVRRSGFAGHRNGMEAAALLCACGHDLPFTPPKSFQAYLPLLKASNTDAQRDFFDALELCLGEEDISLIMPYQLPFEASNQAAPEALSMHYLATLCAGTASPGMTLAEEWYRRSMEAGNTSNAAEALCKRYLSGELPDETGKKAAICLIFSACEEQCYEEDIPDGQGVSLSAEKLTELKEREDLAGETGRRATAQLDACKAEGEALHAQARRNLLARRVREQEKTESCQDTARQKLSVLCQNLESEPRPGRRAAARPDKR